MSDGSHSIRATAVDDTPVVATVIGKEKVREAIQEEGSEDSF